MTVLRQANALRAALTFIPVGAKMTIYTDRKPSGARTNMIAKLEKESSWDDWLILERPKTADASALPPTWPNEDPQVISSQHLADLFENNPHFWADVSA